MLNLGGVYTMLFWSMMAAICAFSLKQLIGSYEDANPRCQSYVWLEFLVFMWHKYSSPMEHMAYLEWFSVMHRLSRGERFWSFAQTATGPWGFWTFLDPLENPSTKSSVSPLSHWITPLSWRHWKLRQRSQDPKTGRKIMTCLVCTNEVTHLFFWSQRLGTLNDLESHPAHSFTPNHWTLNNFESPSNPPQKKLPKQPTLKPDKNNHSKFWPISTNISKPCFQC